MCDHKCTYQYTTGLLKPICSTIIFMMGLIVGMVTISDKNYSLLHKIILITASGLLFYLSQFNLLRLLHKSVSR